MKKIKEIPSGVLAFGVLVSVALFIWLTPKEIVVYVFLSLIVLTVISVFWVLLTLIIDEIRGR